MRIAVMQPYLFPYIGYWQLMAAVDKFVVLDDVNYIKKGWINRNNILVNGAPQLFTVPLKEVSQNKLIKDISLSDDSSWKTKFLRTIETSYKRAPHFNDAFSVIETTVNSSESNSSAFIYNSFKIVLDYLEVNKSFEPSSAIYNNRHLKGEDKILDICRLEKATHYINPIGGTELYSREKFTGMNIKLNFIKSLPVIYRQFSEEFHPNLSMIDILMFNSKEKISGYLNEYELV
jgi:hypothetical protein